MPSVSQSLLGPNEKKLLRAVQADLAALRTTVAALVTDITEVRTKLAADIVDVAAVRTALNNAMTKLNADAGVTDTDYAAAGALTSSAPAALTATAPSALTVTA